MLTFAHPAFLWGLLAVAVPILVHLFNRRQPRPLAFGAIEFVLRSQRQKRRQLRLKQLILLALRCLLVGGVALALARPSLEPKGALAAVQLGPQATALVLDASLSLRARDGSQTLFSRAKAEALAALERLQPEEPAVAVICAGPGGALGGVAAPSFDRVAVRKTLEAAQPTFLGGDLSLCLAQGAQALGQSPVPGKRIMAFSDLAAHSLRLDAPPPLVPGAKEGEGVRPAVVLVDAAQGREIGNAAIVALSVAPAPRLGPRGYEVQATVANFSSAPLSAAPVVLRVGGQLVAKGFIDLPPRGIGKKTLGALLPPGAAVGRVELSRQEAGGLDEDDVQEFVVQVPRDLKALIVDGAPSSLRTRDEAWFVEAALAPQRSQGRILPTTLDADAAEGRALDGFDVVLLLDVAAPKRAFAERLRAFVQKGGGLFIALGDHVDPDAYNEALKGLLPRPLHLIKTALDPAAPEVAAGQPDRAARLGVIDFAHPVFKVFGAQDREGLESARTFRYALLKPDGPGRALASYDDGAPALVEATVGAGRVLLLTTSASANWTDWPIRPSFLPVLQQAVSFLGGALEERASGSSLVGDARALAAPQGAKVAAVAGPDGKEWPVSREEHARAPQAPAGAQAPGRPAEVPVPSAQFVVRAPGVHRVLVEPAAGGTKREEPALAFAARLDPKESDLRRVDEAELKAQLGGAGTAQVASSSRDAQGQRGAPLWGLLLALAALAVLGEGALTRR